MLPGTFDYENVNIGANTRTEFCAGVFDVNFLNIAKNWNYLTKKVLNG